MSTVIPNAISTSATAALTQLRWQSVRNAEATLVLEQENFELRREVQKLKQRGDDFAKQLQMEKRYARMIIFLSTSSVYLIYLINFTSPIYPHLSTTHFIQAWTRLATRLTH